VSWDIFVQDLPKDAKSIAEVPKDFVPGSVGARSEIIAKISEVVPDADFSNPAWGRIDDRSWSIEVNLGEATDVRGFTFHVRGGDEAAAVVGAILERLELRGLDSGTGEFFSVGADALESFRKWRAYRNGAVRRDG